MRSRPASRRATTALMPRRTGVSADSEPHAPARKGKQAACRAPARRNAGRARRRRRAAAHGGGRTGRSQPAADHRGRTRRGRRFRGAFPHPARGRKAGRHQAPSAAGRRRRSGRLRAPGGGFGDRSRQATPRRHQREDAAPRRHFLGASRGRAGVRHRARHLQAASGAGEIGRHVAAGRACWNPAGIRLRSTSSPASTSASPPRTGPARRTAWTR